MYIWKQKCILNAVAFFVEFFRFSNFQHLQKMGILIFPKIVSATIFGLIIHIIKLFQTV